LDSHQDPKERRFTGKETQYSYQYRISRKERDCMFCGECGTQNPDTNRFCINCGKPLKKNLNASPVASPAPAAAPVPVPQEAQQPPKPVSQQLYPVPPPGLTVLQAPTTTTLPATQPEKSHRNWLAIVSFILALVSWVMYPIIIGFFAMGLGIFSLYAAKKKQSKIPVIAVIAVIIGLLAIVLNFFWLDIFPAPAILPPIR
jgi:hypothetical protein